MVVKTDIKTPSWTEDVMEVAARHSADRYVEPMYEMTRRVFPTATSIRVLAEPDPEIADEWFMIFLVTFTPKSVDETLKGRQLWIESSMQIAPTIPGCNFVIHMEAA